MSKRISHSVLDPWLTLPIKARYGRFPIPPRFPPEGIVIAGHLSAIVGAVGFSFATRFWWGGLLAAVAVAGNHLADVLDGTHARKTGQCRNGGELLDHFFDPLSFSYWIVGICHSCGRLDLAVAGVICLYATAVLTSIKAKLTGEFRLSSFGPTEFKTLLVLFGLLQCGSALVRSSPIGAGAAAFWFIAVLLGVGVVQLCANLGRAMIEVNRSGKPADLSEWETVRQAETEANGESIRKSPQQPVLTRSPDGETA